MCNPLRCVLLLCVCVSRPAAAETFKVTAPLAATAPVLDGDVDDAWQHVTAVTVGKIVSGYRKSPEDVSGTLQLMWDATHLYALFIVKDAERKNDSAIEPWNDDGVELYLDGGHERSAYFYDANDCQYIFPASGKDLWASEYTGKHEGVEFKAKEVEGGYRVEIKVPWSDLKVKAPAAGAEVGLDAHIDDDDDGWDMDCALGWSTATADSHTDPSLFGTLVLGGAPEAKEEKAADGEKPAAEEKPAEGEKPADGEKPAEGDKPTEGEKPGEDEKPKAEDK